MYSVSIHMIHDLSSMGSSSGYQRFPKIIVNSSKQVTYFIYDNFHQIASGKVHAYIRNCIRSYIGLEVFCSEKGAAIASQSIHVHLYIAMYIMHIHA